MEEEDSIPLGQCLCGKAAQTGEVLVCKNCDTDPCHVTRWLGMPRQAHYAIPLKAADRVIGVITVYSPISAQIDSDRIAYLRKVGEDAGRAVHTMAEGATSSAL